MSAINNPLDWLRITTMILCVAALALGAARVRFWRRVSRASLLFRGSLVAFLVATVIGAWEQIAVVAPPPGVRSYLFLLAALWALAALVFESHDDHHTEE